MNRTDAEHKSRQLRALAEEQRAAGATEAADLLTSAADEVDAELVALEPLERHLVEVDAAFQAADKAAADARARCCDGSGTTAQAAVATDAARALRSQVDAARSAVTTHLCKRITKPLKPLDAAVARARELIDGAAHAVASAHGQHWNAAQRGTYVAVRETGDGARRSMPDNGGMRPVDAAAIYFEPGFIARALRTAKADDRELLREVFRRRLVWQEKMRARAAMVGETLESAMFDLTPGVVAVTSGCKPIASVHPLVAVERKEGDS